MLNNTKRYKPNEEKYGWYDKYNFYDVYQKHDPLHIRVKMKFNLKSHNRTLMEPYQTQGWAFKVNMIT